MLGAEEVRVAVVLEAPRRGPVDAHAAHRVGCAAAHREPDERDEDERREDVQDELVVELDRAEDVAGRRPRFGDEAQRAEDEVDDDRREDHRHEHQRGDPQGEAGAVVLAVGEDDRQHDQVGEDEGHHAGEAQAARPQHGGQRDVADRADEAQHRDDGPDERAPQRLHGRGRVVEEEAVEEVVAQQRDEAGEQEAGEDLLPQHLPVATEVVRHVRPRLRRGHALAPGQVAAGGVVLVTGVGSLRVHARAASSSGETKGRRSSHMRAIITMPPRYSASVNCQPMRTHSTRPSSHTRLVEANWKASADATEAPFWKRLFAIAMAA